MHAFFHCFTQKEYLRYTNLQNKLYADVKSESVEYPSQNLSHFIPIFHS